MLQDTNRHGPCSERVIRALDAAHTFEFRPELLVGIRKVRRKTQRQVSAASSLEFERYVCIERGKCIPDTDEAMCIGETLGVCVGCLTWCAQTMELVRNLAHMTNTGLAELTGIPERRLIEIERTGHIQAHEVVELEDSLRVALGVDA